MEYLFIYGLQMARILDGCFAIIASILLVTTFILVMSYAFKTNDDDYVKSFKDTRKTSIILLALTIALGLFPSEKTLLFMGATYLGKKAVNQVVTSDKLEKVNTIIDLQLDKYIKELQGATK